MANGNPVDEYLRGLQERAGMREPEEDDEPRFTNPVDAFLSNPGFAAASAIDVMPESIESTGKRFTKGFGRGLLYPVRSFTDIGEGEEAEGGIAGTVGEFAGMGISFVPFFRGGRAVVSGLGLLKPVMREGVKRMAPTAMGRLIEGSLSFGAFEAFAGEEPSEAPVRAVKGLAVGAAFEVGFMGVAAAWRGRFGAFRGAAGAPSPAPVPETSIHPDALRIERWLRPTGEEAPSLLRKKLDIASGVEDQLDIAIAEVARNHMPGGHAVLPGVEDAATMHRLARERGLEAAIWYPDPNEKPWVMLVDNTTTILKPKSQKVREKIVGGVGLSSDEFMKLVRDEIPVDVMDEYWVNLSARGSFSYQPTKIKIAGKDDFWETDIGKFSLLAHEYAHFVTARIAGKNTGIGMKATTVGEPTIRVANFKQVFPDVNPDEWVEGGGTIWDEFWDLTLIAEREKTRAVSPNLGIATARGEAKNRISGDVSYYKREREMLSRAIEAMIHQPQEAMKVAPRAVRLMREEFISTAKPLRELMSSPVQMIDDALQDLWVRRGRQLNIFEQGSPSVTRANMRQFSKEGWFPGMEGLVDGVSVEILARTTIGEGKDKVSGLLIRNLATGTKSKIRKEQLSVPVFPEVVKRGKDIVQEVGDLIQKDPSWLTMWVRTVREVQGENVAQLRKAIVDLEGFEFVDNLGGWIRRNRQLLKVPAGARTSAAVEARNARGVVGLGRESQEVVAKRILEQTESPGLVIRDGLDVKVLLKGQLDEDNASVLLGDEFRSQAFADKGIIRPAGRDGEWYFDMNLDDTLRSLLVEAGVSERELPYFMRVAKEQYEEQLLGIVDPEVREALANARKAVEGVTDDVSKAAYRTRLEEKISNDGLVHIVDNDTGAPVGKFPFRDDAEDFIRRTGFDDAADDMVDASTPSNIAKSGGAAGGGSPPPKMQSQIPDYRFEEGTRSGRLFDAGNVFGATFTALENFASSVEQRGLGPALTKVFEPGQRAMISVLEELSEVKRELLGGISFADQFKKMEKLLRRVPNERRETITDFIEYLSREEIEQAGGLLRRGMNENELRVAKQIAETGLGSDVPRLMATSRLTQAFLQSRSNLDATIKRMREIRLSDEGQELLNLFETLRRTGEDRLTTVDEVFDFLNLTQEERWLINVIEESKRVGQDKFSIMAVSRWSSARPLAEGFESGRAQFAAEQKLSKHELAIAEEVEKIFKATFQESGMEQKRMIGGYFPHLRMWTQHGFAPANVPGAKDEVPDLLEWVSLRVRSGELDVYNKDPLVTAYKHTRGMLMKKHFDPVLPGIKDALEEVKLQDTRAYNIMSEYVSELLGTPHQTFKNAQSVIDGTARALGFKVPEQTINHLVTNLAALAAGATIPFRPALILRNYFQMQQTIVPRVGMKNFWKAVKYVTQPSTKKEAYQAAKNADAILPNFAPIHAATEIFGSPEVGKLSYRLQLMLEKGFEWYKNADDMGRAVAYHAQRMRLQEHLGKYAKDAIDLDELSRLAKIDTYKPIDASRAKALLQAGRYDEAIEFLGQKLARETIFRYGLANHPTGWNSIYGRLFGQFGTWPVQFKDYIAQGLTHGSAKDKAEFAFWNVAINGGILAAGGAASPALGGPKLDLMSWVTFPSLTYTGGPFADMTIDLVKSISGSESEKSLARMSLTQQVPLLGWALTGDPRSVFVPGSYLVGDMVSAGQQRNWVDGLAEGTGFNVMSPGEDVPAVQWLLDLF